MTTAELSRQIEEQLALADELREYAGQWVAVRGEHVVASDSTLRGLIAAIDGKSVDGIQRVPEEAFSGSFF